MFGCQVLAVLKRRDAWSPLTPDAAIVMLTMGEDAEGVARAVSGGARGYIARDASREELASAMTLVLAAGSDMPGQRGSRTRPGGAPPR